VTSSIGLWASWSMCPAPWLGVRWTSRIGGSLTVADISESVAPLDAASESRVIMGGWLMMC
jgi:hypothetical protein